MLKRTYFSIEFNWGMVDALAIRLTFIYIYSYSIGNIFLYTCYSWKKITEPEGEKLIVIDILEN